MLSELCTRGRARLIIVGLASLLGVATGARAQATASSASSGDIVLHAADASRIEGNWQVVEDATAAGGARLWNPDAGVPKLSAALAAPANYVELTFVAEANLGYRLWIRGQAERNTWANDSVYVQFSGAVSSTGAPNYRVGSTSAAWAGIEACSGCGVDGWGWQDNGYGAGVLGPLVYFEQSGPQTIRIQQREDGISLDQIVLSPATYLTLGPGATKQDATILPATAIVGPPGDADVVLHAAEVARIAGNWQLVEDLSAAGGSRLWNENRSVAKLPEALASPVSFFELTFTAEANRPYRLWIRGRADANAWVNDSVYVQFSGTVTSTGTPVYRIGSTSATWAGVEDCSRCGLSGWGWQDNGYGAGVLGPLLYFAATGPQTIRIQQREDGISIDQIVLSPLTYLTAAPGAAKNDQTIVPPSTPSPVAPVAPDPIPAPEPPAPEPPPTGPAMLRVLTWNLHHGVGTDGRYDLDRIATWMAAMNPDVVLLTEVEKYTGWGNENQPERYRAMLEAKTGRTWYMHFAQEYGAWTSNGKGHLILSTYRFDSTDLTEISYDRVIGAATITVNGRLITLMVTHFDPESHSRRLTQAQQTVAWAAARPENRIIAGDLNAWPDQTSIAEMNKTYRDSWVEAGKTGDAISFPGNSPVGATKSGRIDYIFYSRGASQLVPVQSQVYDTRNASGHMPSDHRPVLTTFEVR